MHIFYRLTEINSTNPSPIFAQDKPKLNELCLRSFVNGYRDIKPFVTFLCDHCTPTTTNMIDKICPFDKDIIKMSIGINGTAVKQFMMAEGVLDDTILFQECDYLYQPKIGKKIEKAIKELGMVSPYDHLNYYIDHTMHSETVILKLVDDVHWRSTERDTLTFGIRTDIFKDHSDIFKRYGYLDDNNWKEMKEAGHILFVPIPSFATHMAADWLAPSVNWKWEIDLLKIEMYGKSQS